MERALRSIGTGLWAPAECCQKRFFTEANEGNEAFGWRFFACSAVLLRLCRAASIGG